MGNEGPGDLAMELKGQQRLKCAWGVVLCSLYVGASS